MFLHIYLFNADGHSQEIEHYIDKQLERKSVIVRNPK